MSREEINEILELLKEKKVKNIEAFDLTGKSEIIKYLIIGTGINEKFNKKIAKEIEEYYNNYKRNVHIEGFFPGDWIIIDLGEIIVELFRNDLREKYNLEKLWGDSKNKLKQIKN